MACFKLVPRSFVNLPMQSTYAPFSQQCSWEEEPEFFGGLLHDLNSFMDFDSSPEPVFLSLLQGNPRKRRSTEMAEPCKKRMKKKPPVNTPWVQTMRLEGFGANNIAAKMTEDNTLVLTARKRMGDEEAGFDEIQRVRYIKVPQDVEADTVKLEWRGQGLVRVSGKRVNKAERARKKGKATAEKDARTPSSPEAEDLKTSDAPAPGEMSDALGERCANDEAPSVLEAEKDEKSQDDSFPAGGEEHPSEKTESDGDTEKSLAITNSQDTPLCTRKPGDEFCGGCVVERDGVNHFKLSLDLKEYGADDVKVKGEGNTLTISGDQRKETGSFQWQSHFSRTLTLPRDVNLDQMKSEMEGGKFNVFAPIVTDRDNDIKPVEEGED